MVALVTPLAHIGHWYHVLLYLAPVLLVAGGLWYAGKQLPDEDELGESDELDDLDDDRDVART
jgi:hypothetical protein